MPGLVGFTNTNASPEDSRRALERMRDLLSYGESRHVDELFCDEHVCASRSHTNIIQPHPQPVSESGIHVWFDGEFYNREELLDDFVDTSSFHANDPALLLALYQHDREFKFLNRVDGIYAAVIYDAGSRRVHLISDRYGLRHLFWTAQGNRFAWASEVKAMLELPGFEPKIDRETVDDFFRLGHLTGDRTWFEGVELLPSGTLLTWDLTSHAVDRRRYWWWDDIKPLEGAPDEEELARELGRLFRASVERRSRHGGRVGLTLSGGLDSRAILAAIPEEIRPVAVTFGRKSCDDVRIAARAAAVRGAEHHVAELNVSNWLAPRLEGVWTTDGQLNVMHMHISIVAPLLKQLYDVNLDGFLGDATIGGSYIDNHEGDVKWNLDNRGRRFISQGPSVLRPFVETRLPFFDNEFLKLAMAVPESLRKDSYLYHKMLLLAFPEYFRDIAWQRTGAPIVWPQRDVKRRSFFSEKRQRLSEILEYYGLYRHPTHSYADYANWIRREPASSFFAKLLQDPSALYAEYIPRDQVIHTWERHMKGRDRTDDLGRFLTFEIWLRQVFKGEYRIAPSGM